MIYTHLHVVLKPKMYTGFGDIAVTKIKPDQAVALGVVLQIVQFNRAKSSVRGLGEKIQRGYGR
jgi:hypothetical protein